MQDLPQQNNQEQPEITLREQIEGYIRYWPWFIICAIIAVAIAFGYLRYTTQVYQTIATILIKDEENSSSSELAAFQDLGLTGGLNQSGLGNELEILHSRSLTERVVRKLNLNIAYYNPGNIKSSQLFLNTPFQVTSISPENELRLPAAPFYIEPTTLTQFKLWNDLDKKEAIYNFGDVIPLSFGEVLVTPNLANLKTYLQGTSRPIMVSISTIESAISLYRGQIQVAQGNKSSSIIEFTLNTTLPEKAEAVLDELIWQFNQDAIDDRNMVSQNTAKFIQERLAIITEELDSVETGKVDFKQDNNLTDIAAEGSLYLQNKSEFKNRQLEVDTKLELVNTLLDYIKKGNSFELLPANLGINGEGVSGAIENYNKLILERKRLLQNATEQNPLVESLDSQISEMKNNVLQSMNGVKTGLQITRKDLRSQRSQIGSQISQIPSQEKQFRSISRQQEIKETLYLYLLQKREETAISLAVTTPKAKVVDNAYTLKSPISPNRQIILLGALLAGLIIPFLVIYVRKLLDNKIRSRAYIERKGKDISVVGEIPKLTKNDEELIQKNDRSVLAESFRILRTNLQYLFVGAASEADTGKVIFVTSTVKGEGKTFISVNLALTLAYSGKKVLLVGADIRNPQLQRYMSEAHRTKKGVVEYLVNDDSKVKDFIFPSEDNPNLFVMVSGTIPPNPAELWLQPRAAELFKEVREQFDYVVVDTAPSMLVTDTLIINKYADITMYVMRAGYTEKRLLDFPVDSIKNKKLKNVAFILNDVNIANFGYGNKYGYSYGAEKESWWKRLLTHF